MAANFDLVHVGREKEEKEKKKKRKRKKKERKKNGNIEKKGFCAFCFLFFGRFEKWQEPVFKCMCSWDAVSLSRKTPLF